MIAARDAHSSDSCAALACLDVLWVRQHDTWK